jgi:signal transduction histidine kinase
MLNELINVSYCYNFLVDQIPISLLLYSHIPTALVAFLFSIFVIFKTRSMPAVFLFMTSATFATWSFLDLNAWFAFLGPENTMFSSSLLDVFAILTFLFGYYFFYTFSTNHDLPNWQKIASVILILPIFYISAGGYNISLYDLNSCVALENGNYTIFTYLTEAVILLAMIILYTKQYRNTSNMRQKKRLTLVWLSIFIFLFFFFSANFAVSFLANTEVSTYVYNYLVYSLIGIPIFLVLLGFLVIKYSAFNIGTVSLQALLIALVVLVGSQFTYIYSTTSIILTSTTLITVGIVEVILVISVKKEIIQRQQITSLAENLEKANARLRQLDKQKSEFVSIASHQLRSPLSSIRGYASMLLEGSYGKIPKQVVEPIQRIEQSSKLMTLAIEDYLNVSRIESGNMKYNKTDFNLKDQVENICDELRSDALKRGLILIFRTDLVSRGIVNADLGKTVQVLQNLIYNSIKYTLKGTVRVIIRDDIKNKKIYVDVIDTGIGMSKETMQKIFQKFERATNANDVNINGTGLGLFVAQKMTEVMGGTITAFSEGDNKGSRFTVELPLAI